MIDVIPFNFQGAFLDNHFLNGPLSRSLCSFARTAHFAHLLHSALLRYACFAHLLHPRALSLTLLTPLWNSWISWIYVHAVNAFNANKRVFGAHYKHALSLFVVHPQLYTSLCRLVRRSLVPAHSRLCPCPFASLPPNHPQASNAADHRMLLRLFHSVTKSTTTEYHYAISMPEKKPRALLKLK